MKYRIQTFGCQMNVADSQRLGSELEKLGVNAANETESADVLVVNTCVVRQSAENKAYNWLQRIIREKREQRPDMVVGIMGCMVGVKGNKKLQQAFPEVDVFMAPSDPAPMVDFLENRLGLETERNLIAERHALQDVDFVLPVQDRDNLVSAHVPIVYGCSHACTFCIIPFRRGIERSRPVGEIAAEVRDLAAQGVKEVTLLGQIVDRYGYDVPDGPRLGDLLRVINDIEGIERIRFLTGHPNYMTDDLLETIAELPKVCEHIEVPIQAGDDEVLTNMKRGYTVQEYRELVHRIRRIIPDAAIHCDIIVGFPGETEAQFQGTFDVLEELQLDKVHLARYSPRPGTVSHRRMEDDVPESEKRRRYRLLEELQAEVQTEINAKFLGQTLEILVEERDEIKNRWRGRTRTNKLVFLEDDGDWKGKLVDVEIAWTGPWSMIGHLPGKKPEPTVTQSVELPVIGI